MRRELRGRVAVVTGASKGLGRALVEVLVAEQVRVALFARPSAALDETARSFGDAVLPCPCDIRSPEAVRTAFARALSCFGRLDILINNAAACLVNKVESVPDADIRTEVETNLMAPIWCVREALPHLRASGLGDIINVTSESVTIPVPFMTIYAATKAALETFSIGLREELRGDTIRVTVLRSGHMTTSITDQWSDAQKDAFFGAVANTDRKTGSAVEPATTARTIVDLLRLPAETNARIIELGGR